MSEKDAKHMTAMMAVGLITTVLALVIGAVGVAWLLFRGITALF